MLVMGGSNFDQMLVDSSRLLANIIVEQVGWDLQKHRELYDLAIQGTGQVAMRAARAFDLCDEAHPGLAASLVHEIRETVPGINHQSVQRCLLRLLFRYPLPEDDDELGHFYLYCMELMLDSKLPVALRYYGLRFTYEIGLTLPDLRFELIPMYEELEKTTDGGLKGRAVFYLRELEKKFGKL